MGFQLIFLISALGGAFLWHTMDKRAAVRDAKAGLVAIAEVEALQAEIDELTRLAAVTAKANDVLENEVDAAEAKAIAQRLELEEYENTLQTIDGCVVDPALFGRLRSK